MNEQTLFLQALDQPAGEARQLWLEKECQDPDQRERISKLLRRHESADNFLERPPSELLGQSAAAANAPVLTQTEADSSSKVEKSITKEKFVDRLIRSKLMTVEEVAECDETFEAARSASDAQTYAKALVEANVLTSFQAKAIYEARIKGLTFGEYIILDQLGKGGMGIVYRARHRRMDRLVAIKVLPRFAMATKGMVGRFYREVKTAGKLMHPNIVAALDASEDDGLHYLVMEYVEGNDLRKVLQQSGPLELEHAVDCIIQAARGFQYAHEQGIIHRDIKPANLLIDGNGVVKILDMGLARATSVANEDLARNSSLVTLESEPLSDTATDQAVPLPTILGQDTAAHRDETWLTAAGEVMGTLDYMSPEQFTDSHNVDERGDIYSLGCTLFRLLTDRKPFAADTVGACFNAHRSAPIPALREFRPDVPEQLESVFRRMLAKNPSARQNSMSQVIEELEEALTHLRVSQIETAPQLHPESGTDSATESSDPALSPTLSSTPHLPSTDRPKRRRAIPIGWIAAGSLALSLLAVFVLTQSQYFGRETVSLAADAGKSSSERKADGPTATKPSSSSNPKSEGTDTPNIPQAESSTEPNPRGEASEFPVDPFPTTPEGIEAPGPMQAGGELELWQSTPPPEQSSSKGLDSAFGPFLPKTNSFPGLGNLPQGSPFPPTNRFVEFNEGGKKVSITQNKDGITISLDGRVIEAADPDALRERDPTAYKLYQRVVGSPNMRNMPSASAIGRQREHWESLLKKYSNNPQMKSVIERMLRSMDK